MSEKRVLSIQSHVISGYVGNKSAVFPLQLLGYEVDFVNSVQFSNHTWYKVFKGQVLNANDLAVLYEGLKENNINHYSHVLTGYIGAESFLTQVCDIVKDLKSANPHLVYVCDPVMGDDGTWYVPKELLPVYQQKILPLADVIVPNSWEAEQLTGLRVESEADAIQVMEVLHDKGPGTVVLSSTGLAPESDKLIGYASVRKQGARQCVRMEVRKLPAMFIGTGDLFAALFLAWSNKYPDDIQKVCGLVQSTMSAVLHRTLSAARESAGAGQKPSWAELELKLVQSKADIEQPPDTAVTVTPLQLS